MSCTPPSAFCWGLSFCLLIGRMTGKNRSIKRVCVAAMAGLGILYAIGLPYMYLILNFYMGRDLRSAMCLCGHADILAR